MSKAKKDTAGKRPNINKEINPPLDKDVVKAHHDADDDIRDDPDMEMGSQEDDLDEGELARLDNSND